MDKYIGRLLDNRYEILEVLGTGGMAVVYKARCHRLNRLVAIKILKDDYMDDEEFRRRFHSESQAVAMLSHPNIVSIYDVSSSVTADYIVMELIDGITLKQYMEKKGVLNWKETLHFAIQIAKALEHAHGRGIVHRDIKPHNVMVLKNGSVKVTDFGIARMMSKGNTLTKEALGSVHYISPEQAKGGRVDSRSDLYSLGIVMYEMMSGRPPYDGESPVAVAIQHINGGAVLPSTLNPNIPGGLEQIIMKAMAHEPAKRFGSASDMLKDMDEFRKYPSVLFDYNTPPTDEVTKLQRSPIIFETKQTQSATENQEQKTMEKDTAKEKQPGMPETDGGDKRNHIPIPGNSGTPGKKKPERRKSETKPQKGGNTAAIAVISCSITIILALIVFLVIQFTGDEPPEMVTVPDLVGGNYNIHEQYTDIQIKIHQYVESDAEKDTIVKQYTPAGTEVKKNEIILVDVSKGKTTEPQKYYMPDLSGMEKEKAVAKLKEMDIDLVVDDGTQEYNEEVAAGCVVRTEPAATVEITPDMTVKLVISKGRKIESVLIPESILEIIQWVEGSETAPPSVKESVARDELNSLNLGLTFADTVTGNHNFFLEGDVYDIVVVRRTPNSDKSVTLKGNEIDSLKTGDEITLYVSVGPVCKEMPDLQGKHKDELIRIMQDKDVKFELAYAYSMEHEDDMVISQSEEPGVMVPVTQYVVITISLGPAIRNDIVIDLGNRTEEAGGLVIVKVGDEEIYRVEVEQGETKVSLPEQKGVGNVTFTITFGDSSWEQTEVFSETQ